MLSAEQRLYNATPEQLRVDGDVLARGRERAKTLKAVVCGLARDVEDTLPDLLLQLEQLRGCFADLQVVIYENDSKDGTSSLLRKYATKHPHYHVVSKSLGLMRWPSKRLTARTHHLARCRNVYHSIVSDRFAGHDIAIVMDFDTLAFSLDGLLSTFSRDDWTGVGSIGLSAQPNWENPAKLFNFDVWAWRAYGRALAHPKGDATVKDIVPTLTREWLRVFSAFGGMAVYPMPVFTKFPYRGGDCDHALLHQDQRLHGLDRFYVNPCQLVAVR